MEPASFEAYLALIFAGVILAGLWFALFLIANPSYVKIGKDVDETETFFVIVSSSSKTNTSSKTSASSKSRTSTQDHATGEEKGEAGEKEVSYQLEWWEKAISSIILISWPTQSKQIVKANTAKNAFAWQLLLKKNPRNSIIFT